MSPFSEEDVDGLLDLVGRRDNVRIVDGATHVRLEDTGVLLRTQIIASVRAGRSAIINNAETLSPVIRELRWEIERATRHPVEDCTLFVTPPGRAPLRAHVDAEHVVTLQLSGSKQWTLGALMPVRATAEVALSDADRRTVTVTAGDAFYLPPGVPHVVRALSKPSASLAFGIERVSAVTVLRNALDAYASTRGTDDFDFDWFDRAPSMDAAIREAFSSEAVQAALSITRGNAVRRMASGSRASGLSRERIAPDGGVQRTPVPMHVHTDEDVTILSIPELAVSAPKCVDVASRRAGRS